MTSQVLPQQDFFMYIPEFQKSKSHAVATRKDFPAAQYNVILPAARGEWLKIPLDGPVTVYAHVWNKEDEEIAV